MSQYQDVSKTVDLLGRHHCIDELIDTPTLRQMTGLTREALHARVKAGTLPEPVGQINGGRVWAKQDIDDWFATWPVVKLKTGRKYRQTRLVRLPFQVKQIGPSA